MIDIYVNSDGKDAGIHFYSVWVEGKIYDSFHSSKPLTYPQMYDVAAGYREYFEGG